MSDLGNKKVFAKNLRLLMERFGKDRMQVCSDLGIKYTTFCDWYNGNKYPRIDKIEAMAQYFGVQKSDLIEDKMGVFSIDATPPAPVDERFQKFYSLSPRDQASVVALMEQLLRSQSDE